MCVRGFCLRGDGVLEMLEKGGGGEGMKDTSTYQGGAR